ncbi:FMN-dependent NADH-azoreductase [Micromonosporaceae bacterium Da 78-11]
MSQLLHVNASPRGEQSRSLTIANAFLETLRERQPDIKVDDLSLFEETLPAFGTAAAEAKYAAFSGQEPSGEDAVAWAQARAVFDRFNAADTYVFNVPQWNAGVPYVLKQLIDIITQPGWSFGFDPTKGYSGLLEGKRAFVVYTSGVYSLGAPMEFGVDFHSTFFGDWLRFVGITDVTEVRFQPTVLTATPEEGLQAAVDEARAAAAKF